MTPYIESYLFKTHHHPIFKEVKSIEDCRIFMSYHIYAVWDFMSLVKQVQSLISPTTIPWIPSKDVKFQRFINEIVTAEESDILDDGTYMSHCDMYINAMEEVDAPTTLFNNFIQSCSKNGIDFALTHSHIPYGAKSFIRSTYKILNTMSPHKIVSSFCYGRENIIPIMFQELLDRSHLQFDKAPLFHQYLKKHIELDGEHHGPMAEELVLHVCNNDTEKFQEAEEAAIYAMKSRNKFWDSVLEAIKRDRTIRSLGKKNKTTI